MTIEIDFSKASIKIPESFRINAKVQVGFHAKLY